MLTWIFSSGLLNARYPVRSSRSRSKAIFPNGFVVRRSQASVVSVVGGSNPEMAAFFPFLSEKYTLGQKRTNRGILSKRVNTIYQSLLGFREGAWGVWNNSARTAGLSSLAE